MRTEIYGITCISVGKYYEGEHQAIAHAIKANDADAIEYAAQAMARLIPHNAVIVPIPNHEGKAISTKALSERIAMIAGVPIADVLIGAERESNYQAKKKGKALTVEQMSIRQVRDLPQGKVPYICDNVIDTGITMLAAYKALGKGVGIAYAHNINL